MSDYTREPVAYPTAPQGPSWRALASHRAWLDREANRLLAFARGARTSQGFGWLGADGRLLEGQPQPLWITARFTHVFALGVLSGLPGCAALCRHGLTALTGCFADTEHGGWFAALQDGRPSDTTKDAYGQAFVILALSSATLAGQPGAEAALRQALEVTDRRFWREDEGAFCEIWDQAWQSCEGYRGANANMHMVEALIAAGDALAETVWYHRALRVCERLVHHEARRHDWRVVEHFDAHWIAQPDYNTAFRDHPFRPFGVTPGHGLEWARLLISLRGVLDTPPAWMLEAAQGLFDRAVADGWAEPGGFVYTTDFAGQPVVERRFHWVTTEAIGAAAALHAVTGMAGYETWYRKAWDFAEQHLIDRTAGSWHHELNPDLSRAEGTWSGKPDVYHALQATLIPRLSPAGSLAGALLKEDRP